jgi:hypothetical protein
MVRVTSADSGHPMRVRVGSHVLLLATATLNIFAV